MAEQGGGGNQEGNDNNDNNNNISPQMEELLRRRPGYEYFTVNFDCTEGGNSAGRLLGLTLTARKHRVIVTNLKAGGIAGDKLRLFDRCLAVCDRPVSDKDVAKQSILRSGGKFNLTIERGLTDEARKEFQEDSSPAKRADEDEDEGNNNDKDTAEWNHNNNDKSPEESQSKNVNNSVISPQMEALLRRRPGYEYFTVDFDCTPANRDKPVGLTLRNCKHRVIVAMLKPGGIAAAKLQLLDRIVAVSDQPVSDKDVAKLLILKTGGKFNFTVERPLTEEAKKDFQEQN